MNKNIIIVVALLLAVGVGVFLLAGNGADENGTDTTASERTDERSEGTLEISFLGENYRFEDANCETRSRPGADENEKDLSYRNVEENIEFWVRRYDPEHSDVSQVHMSFPSGGFDETIGEVEAYEGEVPTADITFEEGVGTSGTAELEPYVHMNDDVDHVEEGGTIEWNLSCS